MSFNTLVENCYYKTGREGVVFEAVENLRPNLFDNNKAIDNSILSKSSKFRFTIVDSRKAEDKGRALFYNLDPDEMILLNYLLADGAPAILKKRLGAYSQLNGQEQIELRGIVESFYGIDFQRFDRLLDYTQGKEATGVTFQKNILDYKSPIKDKLIVRKISFSYEEIMKSASKFKVTIELGEGMKDTSKGNGLNIVKSGTYKVTDKTFLMMTRGEIVTPIAEGAKRVMLANHAFYGMMKQAEHHFTKRKFKNKDFTGERLDEWNPQGKSKFPTLERENPESIPDASQEVKPSEVKPSETKPSEAKPSEVKPSEVISKEPASNIQPQFDKTHCSECGIAIDDKVSSFSIRKHKRPLCFTCQKKAVK